MSESQPPTTIRPTLFANRQSSRTPLLGPAKLPSPPRSETSLPPEGTENLEQSKPTSDASEGQQLHRVKSYGSESSSSSSSDESIVRTTSSSNRQRNENGLTPLDQTLEEIGMGRYQLHLLVLCGLGWAADNMYLQGVAVILPRVQRDFGISDRWIGLLSTSIFSGCMVGAFVWGTYSDARGRLPAFNLTLLLTAVFGIASAFAPNFPTLCLALFFLGTGVGGSMPTDGTLFLENIPKTSHYLLTALSVFFSLGAIITSILSLIIFPRFSCNSSPDANDTTCDPETEHRGWRVLLGCLGLISVVMFLARVLFFKLHESAKFLVASKRASAAVVSLKHISKFNGTDSSWGLDDVVDNRDDISKEHSAMRRRIGGLTEDDDNATNYSPSRPPSVSSLALAQEPLLSPPDDEESSSSFSISSYPSSEYARRSPRRRPDWVNRLPRSLRPAVTDYLGRVDELLDGKWRRITFLIWAIWTLASGGYTIFNVFLPKFLEQKLNQGGGSGGSDANLNDSLRDYVLYTLSGLPGSILGAYLVETSFGRTLTLAYSTLATSFGTFIFVFVTGETGVILSSMLVSLAATLMYAVIYSLTPEIFPTALRGTASGIASALSRLSGIVAPLLTGALLSISISLPLFLSAACFFATAGCAWALRGIEEELHLGKSRIRSSSSLH